MKCYECDSDKEAIEDRLNDKLWRIIGELYKNGTLSKKEYAMLCDAEVAGIEAQDGQTQTEIQGRYIRAVQTICKDKS